MTPILARYASVPQVFRFLNHRSEGERQFSLLRRIQQSLLGYVSDLRSNQRNVYMEAYNVLLTGDPNFLIDAFFPLDSYNVFIPIAL